MRSIPFTLCSLALLGLASCSTTPSENASIEIACEDFSGQSTELTRQVEVAAGDTIELWLCSNASTGFEWEDASISESSVLRETLHEFMPPADVKPGAAGREHWTFEAEDAGDCTVSLAYSRPWDGGEKGVWKVTLDVTVD